MSSFKIIRRDRVVFFLITVGFMAIIGRAFYVQVIQTEFLQSEGDKRQIRTIEIPASRGNIFDRNGELMALSTPMAAVWVDPKQMTRLEQKYRQFLSLLNLTDGQLNEYIRSNRHKRLSFIQQVSDKSIIDKIAALELPGTYTKYVDIDFENDGRVIQVDKLLPSVWVDKRLIDRYRYSYSRLAQVLNITTRDLAHKIRARPNRRFMYLERSMVPEIAEKIEAMNLTGVYTQDEYKRYYPSGESNAHLVGFTNIDDKGLEGVELAYNDWLRGTPGKKQVVKDRAGHVVDFIKDVVASKPGKSITLSIDQNIQYFAYRALKEVMAKHQATSASSVILDAKTGEVLSMVSLPGYNPNDSRQRSGIAIRNRVVTDLLEPGSTVKPFVIAKALDLGLIDLDTQIDTSPGSIHIQGQRISDTRNHGILTPKGIIQKSSNVGVSKVALKLSPEQQHDFMSQLGFGRDSGLFLPGESMGYLKPTADWHDLDQASSSYGYSFNINLLNLAHSYLLFTNQGKLLPLSVIKLQQAPVGESLIKADVATEVLKMMETAVSDEGTAPKAQIPGYRVAGKTGTVHKIKRGGYEENSYMALFAGIVPVSDPQFIMVVSVNEPSRGVYYGGLVAAPIFKEVMQEALRLRNIAPDKIVDGHGQSGSK